jgi:hypothetical protein
MKRLVNLIVAAALSLGAVIMSLEPAAAMPMPTSSPAVSSASGAAQTSDLVQVRYDRHHHRHHSRYDRRYHHHRHHWRHHRWHHRHHYRHHHYRHHHHHRNGSHRR